MAGSVNKVIIVGNLGADPEVKSFQNGGQIATMRIATSESWKDRQTGERKERVEWHSIVLQGDNLPSVAQRYLRKGSKVYIEGQLRTRKWQDQNGNDRYSTEVVVAGMGGKLVMLDSANSNGGQDGDSRGERRRGYDDRDNGQEVYNSNKGGWRDGNNDSRGGGSSSGGSWDDLDDDIPF